MRLAPLNQCALYYRLLNFSIIHLIVSVSACSHDGRSTELCLVFVSLNVLGSFNMNTHRYDMVFFKLFVQHLKHCLVSTSNRAICPAGEMFLENPIVKETVGGVESKFVGQRIVCD